MVLTKELMQQYAQAVKELDTINRRIDYFTHAQAKSEHGVVKGSMKNYPYAEKHFVLSGSDVKDDDERQKKIKQLLIDLKSKRDEYDSIVLDIGIEVEMIEDSQTRTILFMKFVEGKSDAEIGKELGFDRSTISKKMKGFFDAQNTKSL